MEDIVTAVCVAIFLGICFLALGRYCRRGAVVNCTDFCAFLCSALRRCLCPRASCHGFGECICRPLHACRARLQDCSCHLSPHTCCSGLRSGAHRNDLGESGEVTGPELSHEQPHLSHRDAPPPYQSCVTSQPREVIANAPPYDVIPNAPPYDAIANAPPYDVIANAPPYDVIATAPAYDENGISDDVLNSISSQTSSYLPGDADADLPVDAYVDENNRVHRIYRPRAYIDATIDSQALTDDELSGDNDDDLSTYNPTTDSQAPTDDELSGDNDDDLSTYNATTDSQAPTDDALADDGPPSYSAVIGSLAPTIDGLPTYSAYINSQAAADNANVTSTPLLERDNPG